MSTFLSNILLALTWAFATGHFSVANLAVGAAMGYFALWANRSVLDDPRYFARVPRTIGFFFFYLGQLILSNLRVAYDVVTPTHYMRPGVIAVPLDASTDAEIALLANLITLTPGSLSVDLSPDRRILYVHLMYIDDGDLGRARRNIKEGLEKRVLQVLR